ncbi:non-ribosomal peptide synthetase [Streptomyces olivochromogenes]|uniref:non-ribosomal peptide synthetase n=1 Tax=Streptomyces olivochromogenes TaxID=1963 RepID=UPI001F41C4E2|nr:amino acid adenylation domain-containing protein [Streptomyces olivochromogenes]MCF3135098.1 amino acid adenylation domain-containing protein [Streptomyces olivochromogenes]
MTDEAPPTDAFPVSPAQGHLLVLERMHPGTALYNVPVAFAVRGPFDADALREALDTVVDRHESLRTVFRTSADGEPVQVVSADVRVDFGVEHDVPAAQANARLAVAALRPFDLAAGPLVRCLVHAVDDGTHRVLLAVHHLVCDGWSLEILLRELSAAYRERTRGVPFAPADLPVQYADFAAWQTERLASGAYQDSVAHWAGELRGAPEALALPVDRPRPAVASFDGAVERTVLTPAAREGLAALARARGVTPFTVFLAAFAAFLGRLTGQDDLVVGIPSYARDRPELYDMVGMLTNTLAVRVDLSGGPSFHDVVDRVHARLVAGRPHQEAPFDAVVEAVAPPRAPGRTPVVQVMLDHVADAEPRLDLPGAEVGRVRLPVDTAQFELLLYVEKWGEDIVPQFVYRTDLHAPETIRRWAENFHTLLDGLLAAPDGPLAAAEALSAAQRRDLLTANDFTAGAAPTSRLVPELILDRAAERPDALALADAHTELTYQQLIDRAGAVARRLRSAGVGPGVPVGLLLPRSADMAVAVLGVLLAGGAFVPLDPAHPAARLAYLVADSGTRLVVAAPATAERAAGLGVPVVRLEDAGAEDGSGEAMSFDADPRDLAYIVYTSGSTGAPKGVAVEHRALANLAVAVRGCSGITAADRVLQHASFGFDVSVADLCFSWVAGAELHIAGEHERLGEALAARLRAARISYVCLSPTAALTVPDPAHLTDLRTLDVGGEPCPAELVERWALPGRRILNGYGPSEATVTCTYGELEPGGPVTIGRAVPGDRTVVLDERLRPVPVGAVGELYVSGASLARGYVGRPAATAERFVADPFGPPGARMYRTGDLARQHADGSLSYVGRVDDQVQVRGVRVELGEIESALASHPGVAVAAVDLRGPERDRWLVGYVTAAAGADEVTDSALRAHLAERLPGHLVPEVFVRLDELPVNRSGKIDRARLPEPPDRRPELAEPYAAARTDAERFVAGVWQRVLGRARVGVHDNFFDLGGNSLRLLAVLTGLREHPDGGAITMVDLFRRPTVSSLAELLGAPAEAPAAGPAGPAPAEAPDRGRLRRERLAARKASSSKGHPR